MGKLLSDVQVAEFMRRGVHFPLRALEPHQALDRLNELQRLERMEGGRLSARTGRKPHLLLTSLAALVRDARILDAVEDLIGPNILCWGSDFFIKDPGDGKVVTWHQDSTYWGLSSTDIVTVWVAFTPSNPENGCLRVVPGSHLHDQLPHRESYASNNMLSRGQEVSVEVDERQAMDVILTPGQASVHNIRLVHGSKANIGASRRIGYAIRYIPTHVRQLNEGRDSASLVRGRDEFSHFILEPEPETDFHPAAVAAHARLIDEQAQILFLGARTKPEVAATGQAPSIGKR